MTDLIDLPEDWESQVAHAYTTFGLDPLDEFGPLDNLRRSAADRAKSALEQARSTGGQFIPMGKDIAASSGRVIRARLGTKLGEYMSRSLQPDLTDNIADHESMPTRIKNAVLSVMKEFFWPTIEEPKRRSGGRGGGGGSRKPKPGDLTPEQQEKLSEAVKWMNESAPPTSRFTENDMGAFQDEDGNLIQKTPEGKWKATDKEGKEVGEYDSAMEAESAIDPQKTKEQHDKNLDEFVEKYKESKNKSVKAIVNVIEERETGPRWMAPKAAATFGEYLQGLRWDENGLPHDAEGNTVSDDPEEFPEASRAIYNLVRLQQVTEKEAPEKKTPAASKPAAPSQPPDAPAPEPAGGSKPYTLQRGESISLTPDANGLRSVTKDGRVIKQVRNDGTVILVGEPEPPAAPEAPAASPAGTPPVAQLEAEYRELIGGGLAGRLKAMEKFAKLTPNQKVAEIKRLKKAQADAAARPPEPLFQSWDRQLPPEGITASVIPGIEQSENPTVEELRLREAIAEQAAAWRVAVESIQQQRRWLTNAKAEFSSYDRLHPRPNHRDYADGLEYKQALTSWETDKIGHRDTINRIARSLNSSSLILGKHRKGFVKAMDALADEQGLTDSRWWNS